MDPIKKVYYQAIDAWLRSHRGKTFNNLRVPEQVREAQLTSRVPQNTLSGFQSCGIYLYNRNIFSKADFLPAVVTDREISQVANHGTKERTGSADTTNDNTASPQISI